MTKKRKKMPGMPMTQFVRFSIDLMGSDGIEVQYPYGWVSAAKLVSLETPEERMDYLLNFTEVQDDCIVINGDTKISRNCIEDGKFSTIASVEIPDFTNGREYFTDKSFQKIIEWCNEYVRKCNEES